MSHSRLAISSLTAALLLLFSPGAGQAQQPSQAVRGGEIRMPLDRASEEIDAIFPQVLQKAREMGLEPPEGAPRPRVVDRNAAVKLEHPLRLRPHSERFLANGISNFVDHDPTAGLKDFACGMRTYDGHRGIDYSFGVYGWRTMDGGDVEIVAAAAGTIVEKADGQYDRQCNWTGAAANYVIVLQSDGLYAFYWHMKKNSLTTKAVGQTVEKGEFLGLVGSSGNSNGPHLHFELREVRSDGNTKADPYAGACAVPASTVSLWKHQHETIDADIIRIATHAGAPPAIVYPNPSPNFCDASGLPINPDPNYSDQFAAGGMVYVAVYLKDQPAGVTAQLELLQPDGSIYYSGLTGAPTSGFYRYSYWYWSLVLPSGASANGIWRARFTLNGVSREHAFQVGGAIPANANLRAVLDPQARSPRTNVAVRSTLYIRNASANEAKGCWVAHDYPLAAEVTFQRLNAAGAAVGAADESFSIAPSSTQKVRVTFKGTSGYTAKDIEIPVRVNCLNGTGPAVQSGYNTFHLSFKSSLTPDIVFTNPLAPSFIATMPAVASSKLVDFVATNAGGAGTQVIRPYLTTSLPVTVRICELDASNVCLAPLAASVSRAFAAGGTGKFRVRVVTTASVPLNEALRRVVLESKDSGAGIRQVRGQTTFAIRTP